MSAASRLAVLLGMGTAGLAAVAAAAFWRPAPPAPQAPTEEPGELVSARATEPLAAFAEIWERPIFAETRRPPAVAASPTPPAPAARPVLRLDGLIAGGDRPRAIFRLQPDGRSLRLGEGESAAGWTVRRIERDRVILAPAAGGADHALARGGVTPP